MTKSLPSEERYSLTVQIRRSSRSVSANLAEASRKIRYDKHFISKLTDCDAETQAWLKYTLACKYIFEELFMELTTKSLEVGRLINYMINNPNKFS